MTWLEELKPGDKVATLGNAYNPPSLTYVERITKTLVITTGGRKWSKSGFYEPGDRGGLYLRRRIIQWTDEVAEKVERHELEGWLTSLAHNVDRNRLVLPLEVLRKMKELLDEMEER